MDTERLGASVTHPNYTALTVLTSVSFTGDGIPFRRHPGGTLMVLNRPRSNDDRIPLAALVTSNLVGDIL